MDSSEAQTTRVTPAAMPEASWRDLLREGRAARLALICLGVWLNAADALVTATAMPSIVRDIGGYAYFAWPVATYLLGAIVGGASAGRLTERGGLRWALCLSSAMYLAGCVISALAPGIALFLAGRVLQGLGAGLIVGACYVAMGILFPNALWRRVMGAISGVWGIATLLGPLLGGIFSEHGHWRMLFWMFAAQAFVFALAALKLVPAKMAQSAGARIPARTLLILGASILAFMAASVTTSSELAVGAVLLALLFFAGALRADEAAQVRLFPRQVANLRSGAGRGYVALFMFSAAAVGFGVYGAAILQMLYGLSPLEAGYVVGAEAMGWTVAALVVGEFSQQREQACIRLGAVLITLGVGSLSFTLVSGSLWLVVLSAIVMGAGFGTCWAYVTRAILEALPQDERTVGSSAVPAMQMVGNAVGAAGAGIIANSLGLAQGITMDDAAAISIWLFVAALPLAGFGTVCAFRLMPQR